jgi:hypothetical protein
VKTNAFCPTGFAHDEAAWKAVDSLPQAPGDEIKQPATALATKLDEIDIHAGRWRSRRIRNNSPIVKADERDRPRNALSSFPQRVGDTASNLVTTAEDRVWMFAAHRKQLSHGVPTPLL